MMRSVSSQVNNTIKKKKDEVGSTDQTIKYIYLYLRRGWSAGVHRIFDLASYAQQCKIDMTTSSHEILYYSVKYALYPYTYILPL